MNASYDCVEQLLKNNCLLNGSFTEGGDAEQADREMLVQVLAREPWTFAVPSWLLRRRPDHVR
jgi:hypothetical protein